MVSELMEKFIREGGRIKETIEHGFIETKLSKIDASLVGKKVKFKALVVGERCGLTFENKILVVCKSCGKILGEIDLAEDENLPKLYEKFVLGQINFSFFESEGFCEESRSGLHKPIINSNENELRDYSIVYIREIPEEVGIFDEDEHSILSSKLWKLIYVGVPKDVRRIEVVAHVVRNLKTDEIEFISKDVKPLEDELSSLKITKRDHEEFLSYFGDDKKFESIIENQIAPHIVGRNFEKLSALLTLHSPCEIYDIFNSRKIRGCIRTIWVGDTKTGKSEIGKDLTYLFYNLGEMLVGETSSRAGLTYTIDQENRIIIWGALPVNDKKFVFIDGLHMVSPEEITQLREVLEQQRIKVSRSVSGERLARVRVIATLNPNNPPMKKYYFKVQGLMDTYVFKNPPDLSRWDLFVPFCVDDVDFNAIATAKPRERPIPKDIFKKHVLWTWTLTPEVIRYTEDAKEYFIECANSLFEFICAEYPIIHNGIRDVLTRVAVAFACLRHSVVFDEDGEFCFVQVRKEHVEMAKNFIEEMIQKIDYDAFVFRIKKQTEIDVVEFLRIIDSLDNTDIDILKELIDGPKSSAKLSSVLKISDRSVREHYKNIRGFGLVETSSGYGIKLTTKGILFLKFLDKNNEGRCETVKSCEANDYGYIKDSCETVKSCEAKIEKNASQRFTASQQVDIYPSKNYLDTDKSEAKNIEKSEIDAIIEEESQKLPKILAEKKGISCYRCGSVDRLIEIEDFVTHKPLWICECCKEEMEKISKSGCVS